MSQVETDKLFHQRAIFAFDELLQLSDSGPEELYLIGHVAHLDLGLVDVVDSLEHDVALADLGQGLTPFFHLFVVLILCCVVMADLFCLLQRPVQLSNVAVEVLSVPLLDERVGLLGM